MLVQDPSWITSLKNDAKVKNPFCFNDYSSFNNLINFSFKNSILITPQIDFIVGMMFAQTRRMKKEIFATSLPSEKKFTYVISSKNPKFAQGPTKQTELKLQVELQFSKISRLTTIPKQKACQKSQDTSSNEIYNIEPTEKENIEFILASQTPILKALIQKIENKKHINISIFQQSLHDLNYLIRRRFSTDSIELYFEVLNLLSLNQGILKEFRKLKDDYVKRRKDHAFNLQGLQVGKNTRKQET